jgi:hypothetical protein
MERDVATMFGAEFGMQMILPAHVINALSSKSVNFWDSTVSG